MCTVSGRGIPLKSRVIGKIRKQNCTYNKEEMGWFRNAIANLYDAVSTPVATTRDALLKRLGDIRSTVNYYYNRARGKPPQRTLKDIVEETSLRRSKTFSICMVARRRNKGDMLE